MENMIKLLKSTFLFQEFTDNELKDLVPFAKQMHIKAHDVLFHQGDSADAFYLIKLGTLELSVSTKSGNDIKVRTISTASFVGEVSFLSKAKRSVTMKSVEPCDLIKITYADMQSYLGKNETIARKLYQGLALSATHHLTRTTEDLAKTRELLTEIHDKHVRAVV